VPRLDEVPAAVARIAKSGDVVITLGAGSIGSIPERLLEVLAS
jgi:UDP-N-acetylmuramate--alanine ligase